jgi:agmatine deiminase
MVKSIKRPNKVYFSSLIKQEKYLTDWEKIEFVLNKHNIKYGFLEGTSDIWCRDYTPIQLSDGSFKQFRYDPSYLKDELEKRSDPGIVNEMNGISADYSVINLDGGNVITCGDKMILTKRIFSENPEIAEESTLIKELEKDLQTQILLIPDLSISDDFTGHADGMVRFMEPNILLVNEFKDEYKYIKEGIQKVIIENNFKPLEIPRFDYPEKEFKDSAIGIYINYLVIENLIIIPKFEVEGNRDEEALQLFKMNFLTHSIEQININSIARDGGLLNCISWGVYEPELRVLANMAGTYFICLAEDADNGKPDRLVIKLNPHEKEIIDKAWSFQKHLKHNGAYMDAVDKKESQIILRKIEQDLNTKDYRGLINELMNPEQESRESIIY